MDKLQLATDALERIVAMYPHSSGCGKIFGFPFQKELLDGCNCGTFQMEQVQIARKALRSIQVSQASHVPTAQCDSEAVGSGNQHSPKGAEDVGNKPASGSSPSPAAEGTSKVTSAVPWVGAEAHEKLYYACQRAQEWADTGVHPKGSNYWMTMFVDRLQEQDVLPASPPAPTQTAEQAAGRAWVISCEVNPKYPAGSYLLVEDTWAAACAWQRSQAPTALEGALEVIRQQEADLIRLDPTRAGLPAPAVNEALAQENEKLRTVLQTIRAQIQIRPEWLHESWKKQIDGLLERPAPTRPGTCKDGYSAEYCGIYHEQPCRPKPDFEEAANLLADGLSHDKHCTADEDGDRCIHCRAIKWVQRYEKGQP